MPKPFRRLTLAEFADLLASFPFERRITAVHMHHTWKPRHADYKGLATIEGMWRYHTTVAGWSDIAQHVTVAPDGSVWTGRGWNEPPASASGHNGNRSAGPFMFETIGDFDRGRDPFGSPQRDAVLEVVARVQMRFGLPVESLLFHNQMSSKSCPGDSLRYAETLEAVRELRGRLEGGGSREAHLRDSPFPPEARAQRRVIESVIETLTGEASRTHDPAEAEHNSGEPQDAGSYEGEGAVDGSRHDRATDCDPEADAGSEWERVGESRRSQSVSSRAGWRRRAAGGEAFGVNLHSRADASGASDEWGLVGGAAASPFVMAGAAAGRRRALCVGIDTYPTAPLGGCVADARKWAAELRALGFDSSLLLDERATREAILAGLSELIGSSKAGDVIVFQYSGHGTVEVDLDGDEVGGNNREDEALCPYDFAEGRLIIDDDVADIFMGIPDGVNLTCFFDCCHSGNISRFAVGVSPANERRASGARPRFVRMTPELKKAHEAFRRRVGSRRSSGSRGADVIRQVVFSACLDSEVAWESDGQGDFTRRAVPLLGAAARGMTNEEFASRVTREFGDLPRQHPELDCSPQSRARAFLSQLSEGVAQWAGSGGELKHAAADGDPASGLGALAGVLRAVAAQLEAPK